LKREPGLQLSDNRGVINIDDGLASWKFSNQYPYQGEWIWKNLDAEQNIFAEKGSSIN